MKLIDKIRRYDPDMLTGYEVQNASWGYLVERGVELGKSKSFERKKYT